MGRLLYGFFLASFTGAMGLAGWMTATNTGVSTPKVVKRSVREGSVGHRMLHGTSYRRGK